MASFHALFFDFSGTLIDEGDDFLAHTDLIREFLTSYKLKGDPQQLCAVFEKYLSDFYDHTLNPTFFKTISSLHVEALFKLVTNELKEKAPFVQYKDLERFEPRVIELHVLHAKMLPGGVDALHVGHKLGLHVGIISDYDDQPLYAMVKKLNLVDYIEGLIKTMKSDLN